MIHYFPLMFLQVKDSDNLRDVALAIIRNEISSVPIFKPSTDSSGMPLLGLATLPGIVKCTESFLIILQLFILTAKLIRASN